MSSFAGPISTFERRAYRYGVKQPRLNCWRNVHGCGCLLSHPRSARLGLALRGNKRGDHIVFDLAISRDYVTTDGHEILKVLNIKGNFT
jgi:hypothetical protein